MKVAFRKTNKPGLLPGLFNDYTRWSLKTGYAHGGVVIGDQLWHTTRDGFIHEPFTNPEEWDLFETPISDELATQRLTPFLGMRYDAFSLLGFKLPFRFSDSHGLNCFEIPWLALTGNNPNKPISPDTIMAELLRQLNEKTHIPFLIDFTYSLSAPAPF
jgi:hypothetical protein